MTHFERVLRGLARRLWLRRCGQKIMVWGFYGALAGIAVTTLSKLVFQGIYPLGFHPDSLKAEFQIIGPLISLPLLGLVIGLIIGIVRKPSITQAILWVDRTGGFNDTLPTIWESLQKGNPNKVETVLIDKADTLVDRISASLAYQNFNVNGIFKLLIAYLVIGLVWWLPSDTSAAALVQQRLNRLIIEESVKIKTVTSSTNKDDLDHLTKDLMRQMDQLAELMMSNKIKPDELLKRLDELSSRVGDDLRLLQLAQDLKQQIALSVGLAMPSSSIHPAQSDELTKKLLAQLEEGIRAGNISLDTRTQLINMLKELQGKGSGSADLVQALQEAQHYLATKEGSLAESLTRFFQALAYKNQEILERLRDRLDITLKEIGQVHPRSLRDKERDRERVEGKRLTSFSRAPSSRNTFRQRSPNTNLGSITTSMTGVRLDETKLLAIEALRQIRESAMQKPFWPTAYDDIIKEYFR